MAATANATTRSTGQILFHSSTRCRQTLGIESTATRWPTRIRAASARPASRPVCSNVVANTDVSDMSAPGDL